MYTSLRFPAVVAFILCGASLLFVPHAARAAQVVVTMTDNQFSPRNISINAGDTVTFVNQGNAPHTATADNGTFDSGSVQPGQQFGAVFNQAGTYAYYCKFHGSPGGGGMSGTITVLAPSTGTSYQPTYPTYSGGTGSQYYVGTPASGSTATQLQAQAEALMAQIAALQGQVQGGTGNATNVTSVSSTAPSTYAASCPLIGRTLKRGVSGDDVSRLQQFLALDSDTGFTSQPTGYFGSLTQTAVQKWQAKYNIVSSGTPDSTGFGVVGPRTAAAISIICAGGSINGVSATAAGSGPAVGGYITVTPVSGNAPLTVSVIATVNTVNSCAGATYNLDFGDSTNPVSISVPANSCGETKQTYPHTYQYGGNYVIKLSAGAHSTTANISVTGPAAPPQPVFTPGLPRESFNASPTSGAVPLTVTFSGIVTSNDAGFCTGGCVATMDYGDGTLDNVPLPASVGGWLNYNLTHTYTQQGGFRATLYQGGATPGQPTIGAVTIIAGAGSTGGGSGGGTSGFSYTPPQVTTNPSNSLAFTIQFDVPSSCTGFDLAWGDSSANARQTDASNTCQVNPIVQSFSHTYPGAGAYTIILRRGPTLSRTDDISLTITN
ncbi:MAG: hypothetical protein RLZZ416_710 [Candidatus Parcubacteria bacterium]|jgi:plastocyanin